MTSEKRTLVLGIGNLLMGDEGVGVHAIREMEKTTVPEHVSLLDGGTGGFHLLSLFQEYDPIIVIDATMDQKPEGDVQLRRPRFASEFPRTLSAHDIGLRDLLESATLLGPLPRLFLVTVSIKDLQTMSTELSPKIRSSLPAVVETVKNILSTEN
ncbi:MAG: HyaD/HybD family hydrogenase maturation endopeptidase [Bacteroidota bacterium]|jgi:hydrogenase maturation protease